MLTDPERSGARPPRTARRRARPDGGRADACLAAALGFFCFLPYPAFPVGGATALQIGNALTLLACLPLLTIAWRERPVWLFVLIVSPLLLSALKVTMTSGRAESMLSLKSIVVWSVSCLTLLATQLHAPRYGRWLLTGIAVATLVHVGLGFWQNYTFSFGVFPFRELYVNPSFLSVQENADVIARYTRRPFGLFPEPSAMTSSLAPWLLFWAAHLCGLVRLTEELPRWQRLLFAAAAAGSVGLMILARSGHTAVTMAALLVFAVAWLARCRANIGTFSIIALAFGIVLPVVVWLAALSVGDRLGGGSSLGNSSWEERATSLVVGFHLVWEGDPPTLVFGLGPGMAAVRLWETARLEAVWSVLLTYLYETGLVGVVCAVATGAYLLGVWAASRFSLAFAAIAVVWLIGVTLTTSYEQLLPIWMALGWLTVWPATCPPPIRTTTESRRRAAPELTDATRVTWGGRGPTFTPAGEPAAPTTRWRAS